MYSKETLTLGPGVNVKDFHFSYADDQDGANDKYDGLVAAIVARPDPITVNELYS